MLHVISRYKDLDYLTLFNLRFHKSSINLAFHHQMGGIISLFKDDRRTEERLIELKSELQHHARTLQMHEKCLRDQKEKTDRHQRLLELLTEDSANLKASTASLEASTAALRDSLEFLRDIVKDNMSNQTNIDRMKAELKNKKDELEKELLKT